MPKYAEIEGVGTLEFPDDTSDSVMDMAVRKHLQEHQRAAVGASQQRKGMLDDVIDVGKRIAQGAAEVPLAVGRGYASIPSVDWLDVAKHPSQLVEAGKGAAAQLAPAVPAAVGATAGAVVGQPVLGAVAGEAAYKGLKDIGKVDWMDVLRHPEQLVEMVRGTPGAASENLKDIATVGGTTRLGAAIPKAIAAGTKYGSRAIPGHGFGEQEAAAKATRALPNLVDAPPSKPIYQAFEQSVATGGPAMIPVPRLAERVAVLSDKLKDIGTSLRGQGLTGIANDVEALAGGGRFLPAPVFHENLKRIGAASRRIKDDWVRGEVDQLYKAAKSDLAKAALDGIPQAQQLIDAAGRYAKEVSKRWLGKTANKSVSYRGSDVAEYTSPGQVVQALRNPKSDAGARAARDFLSRTTPQEQAAVLKELERIGGYSQLPTQGMASAVRRSVAGGAGALAGGLTGVDRYLGFMGGLLAEEALSRAMSTAGGRALIQRLIETQAGANAPVLGGALAQLGILPKELTP